MFFEVHLNGHDGRNYINHRAFYSSLERGRYNGEWFIPTKEILDENLFANRKKGALKGTFTKKSDAAGVARWYWSCTEDLGDLRNRYSRNMVVNNYQWENRNSSFLSTRLVRMELKK